MNDDEMYERLPPAHPLARESYYGYTYEVYDEDYAYSPGPLPAPGSEGAAPPCPHANLLEHNDVNFQTCADCGVTCEVIEYSAEWKYYGARDNKHAKDPSRCHYSVSTSSRNIKKVLEQRKIKEATIAATIKKYDKVVGKTTVRGDKRNGIIVVCLWHSLREEGDVREIREVGDMFGLERKFVSKGLHAYSVAFPGDRTKTITPIDLFPRMLRRAQLSESLHAPIVALYRSIADKSCALNRSNPQSVVASLIWLFLCLHADVKREYDLNKRKYAQRVELSEITISKLAKEAAKGLASRPADLKI